MSALINCNKTSLDLRRIAAPMINQSDLPFRLLVQEYDCTLAYTQMLLPHRLSSDLEYRETHLRDLQRGALVESGRPVIVQLAGNEPEALVRAAREVLPWADGIDLNLGCPQDHAEEGHYGAYLLSSKDWPLVEQIVSSLSSSLSVPVSAKLRLCTPVTQTVKLAARIEHAGASFLALHARFPSSRRRRHGPADLDQVRILKENPDITIPVISNGNVRTRADVRASMELTSADGIMVGETLLNDPCIFSEGETLSPVQAALRYLDLCRDHPDTAPLSNIRAHIRHFLDARRRDWFKSFRAKLDACDDVDEIETLVRKMGRRWMGFTEDGDDKTIASKNKGDDDGLDAMDGLAILS